MLIMNDCNVLIFDGVLIFSLCPLVEMIHTDSLYDHSL